MKYVSLSIKEKQMSQVLVAYTCNPTYSGVRGHEDQDSKPALGK
jgi:hypothetical protein